MLYGGKSTSNGDIVRTTYVRNYFYYPSFETPAPVPYTGPAQLKVCHDEQLYPGPDSAMYPRLETISGHLTMWDKNDRYFSSSPEHGGKLKINVYLQERLLNEYSITANIDLFKMINFPTTTNGTSTLGYVMVPYVDSSTGKSYCPTSDDFSSYQPLPRLLGDYMEDTEGLYVAEKEAETVLDGSTYKTIYGTAFVRETLLKNYGFYINNGVKVRATENDLQEKTIYYYWPIVQTMDPLTSNGRKLFTVKYADSTERASDKRIGCVPVGGSGELYEN